MSPVILIDQKKQHEDRPSTPATQKTPPAKAVLLNDDVHTFDEVARQLVKAVGCSYEKGLALANVVHYTGSAVVYSGPLERCEAVAMILEDIFLRVIVERS